MTFPESPIPILYMTPEQAQEYLHLPETDARLNLGVTVFNRETREGTIIINSRLSSSVQQAVCEQERVQCQMFQQYLDGHLRRSLEDIMPYAHYAGLDADVARAKQLGVLDEFLNARGLGETEESIRSAPRP